MKKLAVFDIDGTIFRWTFIAELMQALTKKGIFPSSVIKDTQDVYLNWKDRRGSWEDYILRVVKVTNEALKGINEQVINNVIEEIINNKKENVYVYTRDLVEKLKQDNYYLIAISASPEKLVEGFTKTLGFDKYYGTIYEVINGKFTGVELNDIIANKHNILSNFLKDNPDITLKDSIGVGDSGSDVSFLEMVENPIAFNPDKKLAEYAKRKKWKIIVERKNVIYDLNKFTFI